MITRHQQIILVSTDCKLATKIRRLIPDVSVNQVLPELVPDAQKGEDIVLAVISDLRHESNEEAFQLAEMVSGSFPNTAQLAITPDWSLCWEERLNSLGLENWICYKNINESTLRRSLRQSVSFASTADLTATRPGRRGKARSEGPVERRFSDQENVSAKLLSHLRVAIDNTPEGMFIVSAGRDAEGEINDFIIDEINFAGENMLECPHGSLAGKSIFDVPLPPSMLEHFRILISDVIKSGKSCQEKIPVVTSKLKKYWIHHKTVKVDDGVVVIVNNVTEQHLKGEEHAHGQELLRSTLRSLSTHIWVIDQDGVITDVNDSWIQNEYDSGFRKRRALGQQFSEVMFYLTQDERIVKEIDAGVKMIANRQSGHFTCEYSRPARQQSPARYYMLSATPLRAGNGGAVLSHHDITQRKNIEIHLSLRTRQQGIVAELGKVAASGASPESLMEEAARLITEGMAVSSALVCQISPDRELCIVKAGAGWETDLRTVTSFELGASGTEVAEVYATGESVVLDNPPTGQYTQSRLFAKEKILCGVLCPINQGKHRWGVLGGLTNETRNFSSDDVNFLISIALLITASLERSAVESVLRHRVGQLAALRTIDLAITASLDLPITLDVLLRQITTQLQVDAAAVLLLDHAEGSLRFMAGRGFKSDAIRHTDIKLGEGFAGAVALSQKIVHVPIITEELNSTLHSALVRNNENLNGYYGIPLIAKSQVEGVLELYERLPMQRDQEWLDFVEALSAQAAIAINNANLFQKLERTNDHLIQAYDQTLEGWARALDYRDRETEGHSRRVTDGTVLLARYMGISEDEIVEIRRGALLHDIGKMAIPDAILLKAGPLDPDEWKIMRKHPEYSYEMLRQIDFLNKALDIPWCHHEKWDGSGYPRGLNSTDIPLAARIFSVVDVWDALRSNRPYRRSWSVERTMDYILEQSDKSFDPAVVQALQSFLHDQPTPMATFK